MAAARGGGRAGRRSRAWPAAARWQPLAKESGKNRGRVAQLRVPVGFQNSATASDLFLLFGPLILVDEAAEDRAAFDPLLGEVGDRVVRADNQC
jgi:hypothetical protein